MEGNLGINRITNALCHEEAKSSGVSLSEDTILLLQQIALSQLSEVVAPDLESFSAHAKRTTIRPEDVLLCARRNPDIVASLSRMVPEKKTRKKKTSDPS